jgi:hypothetical protein
VVLAKSVLHTADESMTLAWPICWPRCPKTLDGMWIGIMMKRLPLGLELQVSIEIEVPHG